jgi:septum formation protein
MTDLILASSSPTRAKLLCDAGVRFTVRPASVDEDAVKTTLLADGAGGRDIADALAELKALRISAAEPNSLVLGADQVLMLGETLFSKAESMSAAAEQLRQLRGRDHLLITVVVLARAGAPIWRHVEISKLTMRDFSDVFLETYLQQVGDGLLGGVGCYQLESRGAQLFASIEGDYFSILGLPLLPLLAALRNQGVMSA